MNEAQAKRHSDAVARQWASLFANRPTPSGTPYSREHIRELLRPYTAKNHALALRLWLVDMLLFGLGEGVVVVAPLWLKLLVSPLLCIVIARLFFLGHDAGHNALTHSPRLNAWLGRLAFLPSLTPYQSWVSAHNAHHAYINSAEIGDIWHPLSYRQYQALSPVRRWLYRIYRHPCGFGVYYLIEIWWKIMYFPTRRIIEQGLGKLLLPDILLVTGFGWLWIMALCSLANITHQALVPLLLLGFALPFSIANAVVGVVSYLHHTHPKTPWHTYHPLPASARPDMAALTTTNHVRLPAWINRGLHSIMTHPVHHVNAGIPCYKLEAAQQKLEDLLPDKVVVQDFSWRWYRECARICKLYDFENRCWVSFAGERLSP